MSPPLEGGQTVKASAVVDHADIDVLRQLNQDFCRSVEHSDVRWFDEILADDFLNSNPDGSLVDRAGFLEQIARPAMISKLEPHDVRIRVLGDIAIIHARTTYEKADSREGTGRYTDVWARRQGRWLCISAHVTRGG
jgi:ketosteroid isomerase-like protein